MVFRLHPRYLLIGTIGSAVTRRTSESLSGGQLEQRMNSTVTNVTQTEGEAR